MEDMVIHPEYEALKTEIKRLAGDISALFEERDELIFHICKNIEADYMLKIGSFEYKAYELQVQILRIKRKIELIQAKINRGEIVFLPEIELQLEKEYAQYRKSLEEMMQQIEGALSRNKGNYLSAEKVSELKKIYRSIVKKLHPDLHPDITDSQKELFVKAISAYENGDLDSLRTIDLLISEADFQSIDKSCGIDELKKKRDSLASVANGISAQIEKIKTSFPYNQKEFLANPRKVENKQEELREMTESYKKILADYEEKLAQMLGGVQNG